MSHSFLSSNPEVGKKTALKLLNKYADSFNCLKEENKVLKKMISDLNINLKINKSIIESFFSKTNQKEFELVYKQNLEKENKNLYEENSALEKKVSELTSKINLQEQTYHELMIQTKDENEKLKTKIFLLEQTLGKKDNIINQQKMKITLCKKGINFSSGRQDEIFVTNPNKIVNTLNNELLVYKGMYNELSDVLKESRGVIDKLEKKLIDVQNENQKLRQDYKSYIFTSNKERETLMAAIQIERNYINGKNSNINNEKNQKNCKEKNQDNKKKKLTKILEIVKLTKIKMFLRIYLNLFLKQIRILILII